MIQRIHHAQITIPSDPSAQSPSGAVSGARSPSGASSGSRSDQTLLAREFYMDLLGLEEIEKPDSLKNRGGFWLQIANQELHISLEDGVERNQTKAHLAYLVDDLQAWKLKLEQAGCEILDGIKIPNYERFETRDPFGNRLEFIAPESKPTRA